MGSLKGKTLGLVLDRDNDSRGAVGAWRAVGWSVVGGGAGLYERADPCDGPAGAGRSGENR